MKGYTIDYLLHLHHQDAYGSEYEVVLSLYHELQKSWPQEEYVGMNNVERGGFFGVMLLAWPPLLR